MRVLVTCPPMLAQIDRFRARFDSLGIELICPNVVQTLSVDELVEIVPGSDGWIIGDDPATRAVFEAGTRGRLRAAVKWGIGTDNVDLEAARELGVPVTNTPFMFGREVADMAMGYVTALARDTFFIDRRIRAGEWPKPVGISLEQKTAALVGFGDIGRNIARRMVAAEMNVIVYDPAYRPADDLPTVVSKAWPDSIEDASFIVLACNLTAANRHLINAQILRRVGPGVRLVNVARGPLIDEEALVHALESGRVHSAALDVMEREPLPLDSPLRNFDRCVFGSHNSSNTADAVWRASERAIDLLLDLLGSRR